MWLGLFGFTALNIGITSIFANTPIGKNMDINPRTLKKSRSLWLFVFVVVLGLNKIMGRMRMNTKRKNAGLTHVFSVKV